MKDNSYEYLARKVGSIFNLRLPTSSKELKKAFAKVVRDNHSDTSKNGSVKLFTEAKELYDLVRDDNRFLAQGSSDITIMGMSISEFGNGYPNNVNTIDCDRCKGKGYNEELMDYIQYGRLTRSKPCRQCRGFGYIRNIEGQEITCLICNGTGYEGEKFDRRVSYSKCYYCGGTGQIMLKNPVLQKGGLG